MHITQIYVNNKVIFLIFRYFSVKIKLLSLFQGIQLRNYKLPST